MAFTSKIIFGIVLAFTALAYFFRFKKEIPNFWVSFFIFFTFGVVLSLIGFILFDIKPVFAYVFPLPAFILIFNYLADFRTAIIAAFIIPLIYGGVFLGNFEIAFTHFISTLLVNFLIYQRKDFTVYLLGSLLAGGVNFAVLFALDFNFRSLPRILGLLLSSGIYSLAFLLISGLLLMFFKNYIKQVSFLELLNLADLNHHLLRRLLQKTPGTYYHSLLVADLSEQAAKAVEADSLLARVGAYFHDIGKLKNPEYYTENQKKKDIYKGMNPKKAAAIVIAHVKEGVEIARKYQLPKAIIQIIAEHHGRTITPLFFTQAARQKLKMKLGDFRYPGPQPQSKESAIVMLADSVEAASRSLKKLDDANIRKLIDKIIKDKFYQGELEDSSLTSKDLSKIQKAFFRVLKGAFHRRISY